MKKYDTEKATRIGYKDYGLAMGDMYYRWEDLYLGEDGKFFLKTTHGYGMEKVPTKYMTEQEVTEWLDSGEATLLENIFDYNKDTVYRFICGGTLLFYSFDSLLGYAKKFFDSFELDGFDTTGCKDLSDLKKYIDKFNSLVENRELYDADTVINIDMLTK